MKIAVCIKRVPDTEARIKIAPDGTSIDEAGVKFGMSTYDEFAVEEALRLKEKSGDGEVVALTVGGDASQETLRMALAMGADRAVLLKSDTSCLDVVAVARVLADELADGGYDLIFFGKMAIDDYQHATGTMVAEMLDLPSVGAVGHLDIGNQKGTADREIEGGVEVVEFSLPAVLTADKGLNEPRYPALRGIMMAKKKPLEVKPVEVASDRVTAVSLTLPPPRPEGRIVGEGPDAVTALIEALQTEAKVL